MRELLTSNNQESASFEPGNEWEEEDHSCDSGSEDDEQNCGIANLHDDCQDIVHRHAASEAALHEPTTKEEDPNSFFYDEIEELMADIEKDEVTLASDDIPDESFLELLGELCARRMERQAYKARIVPGGDGLEDWPPYGDLISYEESLGYHEPRSDESEKRESDHDREDEDSDGDDEGERRAEDTYDIE
ncbi:hypothetical protein EK21DRAFT_106691 [Setomelanomma holmii]|uniref:Uncharacterized protein n=1 Tax=Setomelanomma holmii TaxID=210430 RepID=A0A9P4HKC3_9PLEO|nr:hypothetical protein EK21DRAFT_106691 [Setomelanomma holmii]